MRSWQPINNANDASGNSLLFSDLRLRVLTSLALIPLLILILLAGHWPTLIITVLVLGIAWVEWFRLCQNAPTPAQSFLFLFIGNAYIFFGCALAWFLVYKLGGQPIIALLALIFASDIGAYIFGNLIGGPKLAPAISPKKTISGSIGGFVGTYLAGTFIILMLPLNTAALPFLSSAWFLIGVSFFAQAGDLLESWSKRTLNAKDSGSLFPGHGGILDRLDSVIPVVFFTGACLLLLS